MERYSRARQGRLEERSRSRKRQLASNALTSVASSLERCPKEEEGLGKPRRVDRGSVKVRGGGLRSRLDSRDSLVEARRLKFRSGEFKGKLSFYENSGEFLIVDW